MKDKITTDSIPGINSGVTLALVSALWSKSGILVVCFPVTDAMFTIECFPNLYNNLSQPYNIVAYI